MGVVIKVGEHHYLHIMPEEQAQRVAERRLEIHPESVRAIGRIQDCYFANKKALPDAEQVMIDVANEIAGLIQKSPYNAIVYCAKGQMRSATAVGAYLMVHHGKSADEALAMLQEAYAGVPGQVLSEEKVGSWLRALGEELERRARR